MSEQDKIRNSTQSPIEAVDFDAPSRQPGNASANSNQAQFKRAQIAQREDAAWWQSQLNLMLLAFALLGIATLLFIAFSPSPNDTTQRTLISSDGQATVGESTLSNTASTSPDESTTPFSEAAQQQARNDAQEVLADLLALKKQLEQKQANEWAEGLFEQAIQQATNGDELYSQRDFVGAIESYKAAVSTLQRVEASIPSQINERVAAGRAAIKAGKAALAREKFEAALSLDRNHIPALEGLNRVATLDQLLELLSLAGQHERDFEKSDELNDLTLAESVYQQAVALDSASQAAQEGLQRVTDQIQDKNYRLAMTQGFNALFAQRYRSAQQGFADALKFKPNDTTATGALQQSLAADKRTSLTSLLRDAQRFEQQERWASARSSYQAVLQRDRNQVSAKVGALRSQVRLTLDNSMKDALSDPLSLSNDIARESAESVLADAKGIQNKGPRLNAQIEQLERALAAAEVAVRVALISDKLTQVSLKKEGAKPIELGKFDTKKLALKPGRYTLTGSRLGFRDVRSEIELVPGTQGVQNVTISCTDLIADAG